MNGNIYKFLHVQSSVDGIIHRRGNINGASEETR